MQMRQCNGCGSVRNVIFSSHLGSGADLLISSTQTIISGETKNPEKRSNSQQIISYCLSEHTHNSGLREVDMEPSPKRDSDKKKQLN